MAPFDRFKKIMKEAAPTAARLAEELDAARQLEAGIQAELTRLQAERVTLLEADDAVQRKNRNAINEARDQVEDVKLYVVELARRHTAATDAERQKILEEAHASARKLSEQAAKTLTKEYPAAARKLLEILRTITEAQLAIDNVVAAGGPYIEGPEALARSFNGEMAEQLCTKINLPGLKKYEAPYFETVRPFYDGMTGRTSGDPAVVLGAITAALAEKR